MGPLKELYTLNLEQRGSQKMASGYGGGLEFRRVRYNGSKPSARIRSYEYLKYLGGT